MSKQEIIRKLKDTVDELDKLIAKIDKTKAMKEEGRLVCKNQGGKVRFFRHKNCRAEYLGKSREPEIQALATKSYGVRLRDAAQREMAQLNECLKLLDSQKTSKGRDLADIDLAYDTVSEPARKYINPSVVTDDGFALKWQESFHYTKPKDASNRYKTKRGEYVRSKSELIIANMLHDAGVPYKYEMTIALDIDFLLVNSPDFTVLNKRTRQEFIWEHHGRMDDPDYCNDKIYMLSKYMEKGYFPGKNLILTFETSKHPLRVEDIEMIIKEYLI